MKSMLRMMLIAAIGLGITAQSVASSRTRLSVDPDTSESRVQFTSDAPLEKITGVGNTLKGEVELDPSAIASTRGKIELEVASIRTNIELRDEHLRGPDWLDAKKYPTIKFEIASVEAPTVALTPEQPVDVRVRGKLTMHGVTRDETATAKVRWLADQSIRLQAQFKVNLTHYKVSVPSLVRLKVSDEIGLNVMLKVRPKSAHHPL